MADRKPSRLERAAARARAASAREEAALRRTLLPTWRRTRANLAEQIDELTRLIERATQQGIEPTATWLHKQARYEALLDQVEVRIAELAEAAGQPVADYQAEAVRQADEHAERMARAALGDVSAAGTNAVMSDWDRLDVDAAEQLIGNAGDGRPLGDLLEEVAPAARSRAAQILTEGVALGRNPRTIARQLQNVSEESLRRLLTIARTEALRAQREATLASYKANRKIVSGWIWHAQLDDRTCEACAAMSGQEMGFGELDGHPNCRCVMVPKLRSWDDLGLGDLGLEETSPAGSIETGPEWFARQSEVTQLAILGPAKLEALNAGEIDWPDLVKRTRNRRWGTMRRPTSLREAKRKAAQRRG